MKNFIALCYQKMKIGGKLFIGDILDDDLKKEYTEYRINQIGKKNNIMKNIKILVYLIFIFLKKNYRI